MTSKTKVCTTCQKELPLNAFSKKGTNPDGLQYSCKECYNKQRREYNEKHRDVVRQAVRTYYQNNKETILSRARETYHQKRGG